MTIATSGGEGDGRHGSIPEPSPPCLIGLWRGYTTAGGSRRFLSLPVRFCLPPAALVPLPPGAVRSAARDVVAMDRYLATWCPTGRSRRLALGAVGFGAVLLGGLVTARRSSEAPPSQPLPTARALLRFLVFA